ncbi:hypothetical protein [Hymenobacter sp. PAMC 26628]|uniref:hypothetical protein n=1 Tax=Hymenobacter sp. PAMC 26628 TaxID=1484118 RepID=UPI001F1F2D00|nr:hypothetical protein [Hymenobacter sp. PAMC 26628]
MHPNTISNYIQSSEIKLDVWRQIATALKKDLNDLVPGLQLFRTPNPAAEPATLYSSPPVPPVAETLSACQKELMSLQAAYITLMQEHLALLRSLSSNPQPTS